MRNESLKSYLSFLLTVVAACSPPEVTLSSPDALRKNAAETLITGASCSAVRLSTEPDLLGWDPGSRAKLVSIASQGLAVVRYEQEGCDVRLSTLPGCFSRKSVYEYRAYSETQSKTATDELELYAEFPMAVAELRSHVRHGRGVRADYRLAGVQRVPVGTNFRANDIEGQCEGATHVVSAIYRGAFALGTGEEAALGVRVTLFDSEATKTLELLDHAGDESACRVGGELNSGCDVPLRLELTIIEEAEQLGSAEVETQSALPVAETDLGERVCPPQMAAIPGGAGTLPQKNAGYQEASRSVTLSPYCLDLREVTVGEYGRCVNAGVCPAPRIDRGVHLYEMCPVPGKGRDNFPRGCVSWQEAKRYCEFVDKRLPTAAEWTYAATGGPKSFMYPWGNSDARLDSGCWNRKEEGPCPVGSYPPGSYGLWDMDANLQEWVWDWFGTPDRQSAVDPTGPRVGSQRLIKGGSFIADIPLLLRGNWGTHGKRNGWTGFRCARDR